MPPAGPTDAVICYNGKRHYRCSWLTFDNGAPFCLFAFRLYNWEWLGDPRHPKMTDQYAVINRVGERAAAEACRRAGIVPPAWLTTCGAH